MSFSAANPTGMMGEMNTTPLIDVLLVLLIMFIMVIPSATNSVELDLPQDCRTCPLPPLGQVKNLITLDEGDQVRWNGEQVDQKQLSVILAQTRTLAIEPELQFEPSATASYDASARTLAVIKASGVTRFGFVGNERYREF